MTLRLAAPWLLALLVPLAVLALAVRRAGQGSRVALGHRVLTVVQWGAAGLVVVALAQPGVSRGPRPPTVLAVDRSASVDAPMRSEQAAWLRAAAADCPHPCRVVRYARAAEVVPATGRALEGRPSAGSAARGADVLGAVRAAIALVPRGGRVVVLSGGAVTGGDPLALVAPARARGVRVDVVTLADPSRRDAAVTQLEVPAAAHAGDPLPVQVTVRSTVAGPAQLVLARDGRRLGARSVRLRVGDEPFQLALTAGDPGWHALTATVELRGDAIPGNDRLAAVVDVLPAPRVLAVGTGSGPPAHLTGLLRGLGFQVAAATAGRLPATAAAYAPYDAMVLDDVPAASITGAGAAALAVAVRDRGLGLVVLGGSHSFSLGGYSRSAIESLLPVSSLVPGNQQHGNVAIELVLDHSGSMSEQAGGVTKIQMVHVAGVETARFVAAHADDLGVVDFDAAAHLLVPMQRIVPGRAEQAAIARVLGLQANGGTDIYAGLLAGARQVELSPAPQKHLILMTDGISQAEDYGPLLRALRRAHITVATIALGADADRPLLRYIAHQTGGRYYAPLNAGQLPAIFAREARIAVRPVAAAGTIPVVPGSDSALLGGLGPGTLPDLGGVVITTLDPGAQADLLARGPGGRLVPALAQWQDGLGRVAVWTPGLSAAWARRWAGRAGFWNGVVRWAERGAAAPPLTPVALPGSPPTLGLDLAPAGVGVLGIPALTGELTGAGGRVIRLRFQEAGPARYRARPAALAAGVYRYRITAPGAPQLASAGEVAVPYPDLELPHPRGDSPLLQLAARTGGRVLAPTEPQALSRGGWQALWWPVAAVALGLFLLGALVRLLWRPRGGAPPRGPAPGVPADSEPEPALRR